MPRTKTVETQLKLTISLSDVLELKSENATLKAQVSELQAKIDLLEAKLKGLTDPAKQADIAAFKRARRIDR